MILVKASIRAIITMPLLQLGVKIEAIRLSEKRSIASGRDSKLH